VIDAMIAGDAVVLAVDADSKTYVNVLDVATAAPRLQKDVKIKGQLAYAELTPVGLLYISRSDASTSGEVNIIDLAGGEPKYKDAIEGRKSAALLHTVEGSTLYVFAPKDRRLYAVNRQDGTYRALSGEIKLQGDEDPTGLELRSAGLVLVAPQNLVLVTRDGEIKQQIYNPAPQLPGPMATRSPRPHARPRTPPPSASRPSSPQPTRRAGRSCRATRASRRRSPRNGSRPRSRRPARFSC
jgi:hypothetical protein